MGMALFLALGIISLIFILGIRFHFVARDVRFQAYRYQQSAILEEIAEAAMAEAVQTLNQKGKMVDSPEYRFLCALQPDKSMAINVSRASELFQDFSFGSLVPTVSVTAKFSGPSFNRFAGIPFFHEDGMQEGANELIIEVIAEWQDRKGSSKKKFSITKHQIILVSSLRSKDRPSSVHIPNICLDYALFVRNARTNFQKNPQAFNPTPPREIVFDPFAAKSGGGPQCAGKIRLAGDRDQPPVALNIGPNMENLLPGFNDKERIRFFYRKLTEQQASQIFNRLESYGLYGFYGALFVGCSPLFSQPSDLSDYWEQKGIDEKEKEGVVNVFNQIAGSFFGKNIFPGIFILGQNSKLWQEPFISECISGDIRQSFLLGVGFRVDTGSNGDEPQSSQLEWLPAVAPDESQVVKLFFSPNWHEAIELGAKLLPDFLNDRSIGFFVSAKNTMFPYQPGLDLDFSSQKPPVKSDSETFTTPDGKVVDAKGYYPFFDQSLYVEEFPQAASNNSEKSENLHENLTTLGIVDCQNNLIKVSNYHIATNQTTSTKLVLQTSDGQPFTVWGQGIVMADEIVIKSGIKKNRPEDFLVLVSIVKPLVIDTDQEVEAYLASPYWLPEEMKDGGGTVIGRQATKLHGGIMAYDMNFEDWAAAKHEIVYDPIFSGKVSGPLFRPAVLRKPVFLRYSEE
jgi:hypothetical protein